MKHLRTLRPLALALAAALPGAAPVAAQPPGNGAPAPGELFADSIRVDLVNVELFVTDRAGDPVLDLLPGEVRLFEDRREVELTHFALVRPPAATGRTRAGREAVPEGQGEAPFLQEPQPVRIVVFLDLLHTGPASRGRIGPGVARALEREMGAGDQVMIVAYDGALDVMLPFTSKLEEVREALEGPQRITAHQLQGQFADHRALEAVQLNQIVEAGSQKHPEGVCVHVGGLAEPFAEEAYHRVQQTIDALTGFVDSLAGLPGRKVLLHVSDGIPLVPGGEVLSYAIELCDGTGAAEGVPYAQDSALLGQGQYQRWNPLAAKQRLNELDTTRDWQRLAAHANVEQVSFYPVQAAGLANHRLVDASSDVRRSGRTLTFGARNQQDTLDLIARETGGRATLNGNQPGLGVEAALRDSRTHYLVAFEPSRSEPGTVHRIRVEVDRPGVQVRHRKSYRTKGAHEQVADGVLTALLYGEVENPLEARLLTASSDPMSGGRRRVRLRLLVPLSHLTLFARDQRFDGLFTVFVAARDRETGDTTPVRQASIPVSVPLEGMTRDFVYEVELSLGTGRQDVAVGVRDELGGTTAFLRGEVPPRGSG